MQNMTSASDNQQSMMMMMMMMMTEKEKQPKLPEAEQPNCPRCDSSNTKFCYYNNYNLSQPRYYCKNCRRYWTKGGTLRNIPVGGGTRKNNKRPLSSSSSSTHTNNILDATDHKDPGDHRGTQSVSVSRLEEEKRVTGQEMDSNRMSYGLPVGVDPSAGGSFSSLLASNMGITYETGSGLVSGYKFGFHEER